MRTMFTAGMATLLLLAAGAPAASAKPKAYTYTATIDCGSGAVTVGSTDNLFAPLVDLASGREYRPVAWDLVVHDAPFEAHKGKGLLRRAVACTYDDGVAVGTVYVKGD